MRRIVSTVAVVCLMATMAGAQTSVGFEETADLADLLAYRLPDWGWRTWDLAGELQGGGNATKSINPSAEARRDQSDHSFRLATDFRLERESENHDLAVRLWGDGAWQRSRTGIGDSGDHNSTLTGEYDVSARGRLHVAQIFYLTDVLQEDLSGRVQGARLEVEGSWYKGGSDGDAVYETLYRLSSHLSRNLSLAHQIGGYLAGGWRTVKGPGDDYHQWWATVGAEYLWNVADSLRLEGDLWGRWNRHEPEDFDLTRDEYTIAADLKLDVRLEDRLSLRPYFGARWNQQTNEGEWRNYRRTWQWQYGVTINYRLDGLLL